MRIQINYNVTICTTDKNSSNVRLMNSADHGQRAQKKLSCGCFYMENNLGSRKRFQGVPRHVLTRMVYTFQTFARYL